MNNKEEYKAKIRSLGFSKRMGQSKTVRDEIGNDITEHWDGKQDVKINSPIVSLRSKLIDDSV